MPRETQARVDSEVDSESMVFVYLFALYSFSYKRQRSNLENQVLDVLQSLKLEHFLLYHGWL